MGYLQDKQREAQRMLDYCEYELSQEVTDRKKFWQAKIADLIENDTHDSVLNIADECITVETEEYDSFTNATYTNDVNVVTVCSNDGEVYVTDADGNEYFIDDINENTFKQIYEAVSDLASKLKNNNIFT